MPPEIRDELFELAFEHAAIGMALVAPSGKWLKVNPALCHILGYTGPELLRTNFQAITHPEDLAADLGHVTQVLEGEIRDYSMRKRYFHKTGRIVHVQLNVSLVREPDGRPKFFISQIQDITEIVQAQQDLLDANKKLASALQEVKELRGFLPICSYCKSVRSDKDYWQSLETYISEHSSTQFTHGICPECLQKVREEFARQLT